ncbi:MAG: hydrogenase formation protein HypD [Bacteroidetes bacterium 4484_276]|nr:MAG: hydrogenase formation protein HypD [Bacteroidetes bacterium 4484_276]OYT14223.1 MAG: hydrogenase formation protein HypD [Bacteroidetes bacterium 4572_114]
MKYIDEYRNKGLVIKIADRIKKISTRKVNLMEVCGGHTMSIQKFGIPYLLPATVNLLSGPGCPVCVSSRKFIDHAVALSRLPNVVIATFGDLIRVPGSTSTLDKEKAAGADIRIVYSIMEAINFAIKLPEKKIIFLGIGFETTAPTSAAGIAYADKENIGNFFFLSSHKIMPPAMSALIDEGVKIDGYIGPGHVSTITGSGMYEDIAGKFNLGVVISGFEPVDLLQSIYMLVDQIENNRQEVAIQYKRFVKPEGNTKAKQLLEDVFELKDDWWRGLGILPKSGLQLREKYARFDATKNFEVEIEKTIEPKGCICGEILKGLKTPKDCKLFAKACSPQNPIGACMVSSEGSCHAFYKYNRG